MVSRARCVMRATPSHIWLTTLPPSASATAHVMCPGHIPVVQVHCVVIRYNNRNLKAYFGRPTTSDAGHGTVSRATYLAVIQ